MRTSSYASLAIIVSVTAACAPAAPPAADSPTTGSRCPLAAATRIDAHRPAVMAPGWGDPQPVGPSVNTPCPEDAIEISRDGQSLFFFFTTRPLADLAPAEYFSPTNGTYRAMRLGGPGDFGEPVRLDLGKGSEGSLDGELSFSPDGQTVYFHSLRAENTGYQQNPPTDDFLDIYVTPWLNGEPGPARNLGQPVNSSYPDGEHALHPNGAMYFTSSRPGGLGGNDIWTSTLAGGVWSEPANLGEPVNSASGELQPAFSQDGTTMYFTSDRDPEVGPAIYRSIYGPEGWSSPELVIRGVVGEPSLTGDGSILYFVHVLTDASGVFDADVWFTHRSS